MTKDRINGEFHVTLYYTLQNVHVCPGYLGSVLKKGLSQGLSSKLSKFVLTFGKNMLRPLCLF